MEKTFCQDLPLISFLFSLIVLIILYGSLLSPLLNNRLEFAFGDLSPTLGTDSGAIMYQMIYYIFNQRLGASSETIGRAFLLGSVSILANIARISESQVLSIITLVSIVLGCYGIYKLTILFEKRRKYQAILIPTLTLFYYLNLWSAERIGHIWIWFAYAIFPLYLYFGLTYILNRNPKHLILYSLLFAIYGIIPHNTIYMLVIHVFLTLFSFFVFGRNMKNLLLFIGIPIVIYSLANMPPILLLLMVRGLEYPVPISIDQLAMLSRNGYLINILTFSNNWWPQVSAALLENPLFRGSSLLIFALVFYLSILRPLSQEKYHTILILLSQVFIIILIFFILGTNNPLLLSIMHFFGQLGRIDLFGPLREWGRLSILIPIFFIIILLRGFASLRDRSGFILVLVFLALVTINIASSPSLVYINEIYSPTYIPQEYYDLRDRIPIDHKILWVYPSSAQNILGTWRYVWNDRKAISQNLERSIGSTHNPALEYARILSLKEAPWQLLDALNIKYVIKRTDILGASSFRVDYQYLDCNRLVYLTVCENPHNTSIFYVPKILVLSDLDGKNFYSVAFPPSSSSVSAATTSRSDVVEAAQAVLIDFKSLWLYEKAKEKGIILAPYKFTYYTNPGEFWSRASTTNPLHAEFYPYLEALGLENWQSDYGEGLVFTRASTRLKDDLMPSDNDLIYRWSFTSTNDLNEWKNYTQEDHAYRITLDNGALKAELWNSTQDWKTINSPLVEVKYGSWYRWEFQLKTENAYEVHVKVIEYDQDKKVVNSERVKSIGTGSFDWRIVTIDYTPKNLGTRYIQLQIWHGHETPQPLPNRIWVKDVKIYDLRRFTEPVALEMPLTVQKTDEYVLMIRFFQNQQGGRIQIQLGDKSYTINTRDQLNKFVWKEVDMLKLERGNYKMVLTNIEGFNAVNLIALIPRQDYEDIQAGFERLLQGKRIIYILEAEADLYSQDAVVLSEYGWRASNGQVLRLNQTSKAWREIEIIEPGDYMLAIRSKGNLAVSIDGKKYNISTQQPAWTYIGPISLGKGKHLIEIISISTNTQDPSDLDVIWLYSTQGRETLEDILTSRENPAEVISYQRIDPTKYVVKVNAVKPFILAFAESYDPSWVAYVNGERTRSIPLYGVINGFWINRTGLLEITIEYEPQRLFYIGLAISIATLAACIAYLAYEWIKNKIILGWVRKRLKLNPS